MFGSNTVRLLFEKKRKLIAKQREEQRAAKYKKLDDAIEKNDCTKLKDAHEVNDMMAWEKEDIDTSDDDNEYFNSNNEPKVIVTTSRNPSANLKKFSKEIHHLIPFSTRLNRGSTTVSDLIRRCLSLEHTDLVIVEENRGNPKSLIISHMPHGPTIELNIEKVEMRHNMDLDTETGGKHKMPTELPKLKFAGFTSKLGERVGTILAHIFKCAQKESSHYIIFSEQKDVIKLNNVTFKKAGENKMTDLKEHGPEMLLTVQRLYRGTIADKESAVVEFANRPFMNTAGTKFYLSLPPDELKKKTEDDGDER